MDLRNLGWSSYAPNQISDSAYGRVALAAREHFVIWTEQGELKATLSGRLRHSGKDLPSIGDWVVLEEGNVVAEVLPRRTTLSRRAPGKAAREQVLAANIDVLFIVSGLDHEYNPRRLERYLVLAYESGARPVVLLNKADLRADADDVVSGTQTSVPGVPVCAISARTGRGMERIRDDMRPGQTAALVGSSGVGKSTIINCLLHEQRQRTMQVRTSDSKGRHTTTTRELIRMPGDWFLIDLPGLRELQLWAYPEQIDDAFSDIVDLSANCRFRDCTHQHEPGCAVRAAGLDERRLSSYQKLTREVAFLERQVDANLARETKNKRKSSHKQMRRHPKRFG